MQSVSNNTVVFSCTLCLCVCVIYDPVTSVELKRLNLSINRSATDCAVHVYRYIMKLSSKLLQSYYLLGSQYMYNIVSVLAFSHAALIGM